MHIDINDIVAKLRSKQVWVGHDNYTHTEAIGHARSTTPFEAADLLEILGRALQALGQANTSPLALKRAKDAKRFTAICDLLCSDDGEAFMAIFEAVPFAGSFPTKEELTAALDAYLAEQNQPASA